MEDGTTGQVEGRDEEGVERRVDGGIGIGIGGHIPGKAEEPAGTRKGGRSCVDVFFEGVDLTACDDWHQTNLNMHTLASRFPSARFRAKVLRLGIS